MKPSAVIVTLALLLSALSPIVALAVSEGGVDASTYVDGTTFALSAPAAAPSAGPTGLQASQQGVSVVLSWNAPLLGIGETIDGYNIHRTPSASTPLGSTDAGTTTYTDFNPGLGTEFTYWVNAYSGTDESAQSNEVKITLIDLPDAPTNLQATAGDGQVSLSWTAPSDTGGASIQSYNVYMDGGVDPVTTSTGTSATVSGLTNGNSYTFSVAAVNSAGTGAKSSTVSATPTTGATVPAAPTGLQATPGNGQASLSWTAPSNGGTAIDYYVVNQINSGVSTDVLHATGTTATVPGLTNGVLYEFTVAAHNSAGLGPESSRASTTPQAPDQAPSAPRSLAASAESGKITLNWLVPSTSGSTVISGYNIYRSETTSRPDTALATATGLSYEDTSIENGKRYYYWVTAVNSVGQSPVSNRADAAFMVAPAAPTDLVATGGGGFISLAWSAPANTGGGTLSYEVYRGTSADTLSKLADAASTSYTDSSVEAGVTYFYAVNAKNSAGVSDLSGTVQASASAVQSVPSTPQGLNAAPNNGTVMLSWAAPENNGGSDITQYRVYRGTTASALSQIGVTANLMYNDTTSKKGETYYYAVSAVNSFGEGARTSALLVSVPNTSVPSIPVSLTAKMSGGNVVLTWDVPDSDGGAAVTGYKVYRGTSLATMSYITTAYDTTYEDMGRRDGVTYYYSVAAMNEAGDGPSTAAISIAVPKDSVVDSPLGLFAIAGLAVVGVGSVLFLLRRSRTGP